MKSFTDNVTWLKSGCDQRECSNIGRCASSPHIAKTAPANITALSGRSQYHIVPVSAYRRKSGLKV
eukprot:5447617-Pleurochrysis_carterae.AAC.1